MPETTPSHRLRDHRALRSALAGVTFQGVYALGQFVAMAILIRSLGPQRFGMWLMIFALSAWMAFTKFGLQFTLYTAMGQHAQTDRARSRAILSNAAGFVALLGVLAAVALGAFGGLLPWATWLNVTDPQAVQEAAPITVLVLVMAALAMPLMMGGHALNASQRGDLTQGLAAGAQLLMIGALGLGRHFSWPFPALAAVVMSPPLIAGAAQWGVGLGWGILPRPGLAVFDRALLRRLLAAGCLFMLLDLANITLLQGGVLILGHTTAVEAVVPYGAAYRLIGLLIAAVMMVCYAYWPAYSEAGQRRDLAWVRRGVRRSVGLVLGLCVAGGCVILTIGRPFIGWWLGAEAVPTHATLFSALGFAASFGFYAVLGAPLSGLGRLRVQLAAAGVMVVLFAGLGLLLSDRYGAAGLYAGQALAALTGAGINAVSLRRVMRELSDTAGDA